MRIFFSLIFFTCTLLYLRISDADQANLLSRIIRAVNTTQNNSSDQPWFQYGRNQSFNPPPWDWNNRPFGGFPPHQRPGFPPHEMPGFPPHERPGFPHHERPRFGAGGPLDFHPCCSPPPPCCQPPFEFPRWPTTGPGFGSNGTQRPEKNNNTIIGGSNDDNSSKPGAGKNDTSTWGPELLDMGENSL